TRSKRDWSSDVCSSDLTELALDVVFGREAVAAVRVERGVRGVPRRLRREELRHVRLGTARLATIEEPRRLVADERRGLEPRVRLGDRKLHALVLADRSAEHDPLARVTRGALDEPATVTKRLGRDEDALDVPAVDDV